MRKGRNKSQRIQIKIRIMAFTKEALSARFLNWADPLEEEEWSDLKRYSKIAIMRNININIAVATNPNEIAFIGDPE